MREDGLYNIQEFGWEFEKFDIHSFGYFLWSKTCE